MQITPLQIEFKNTGIDQKVLIQAGAIFLYDGINAQQPSCIISSTGDISVQGDITSQSDIVSHGTIRGETLTFKWNDNTYSVGSLISQLWNEVFGGGM